MRFRVSFCCYLRTYSAIEHFGSLYRITVQRCDIFRTNVSYFKYITAKKRCTGLGFYCRKIFFENLLVWETLTIVFHNNGTSETVTLPYFQ